VIGYMFFDTADLAGLQSSGDLNDVILHEMGHVLGFGTSWEPPAPDSLLTSTGTINGSTVGFFGPNAVAAFTGSNGGSGTAVPVEDNGVVGTTRSHWKESVFQSELMTGFISGVAHPLSLTTVESMADLGYTVNAGAADSFNLATQPTLRAGDGSHGLDLTNDIIRAPRRFIDEVTGRIVPAPAQ
jgi:Leishmanolysin